MLVFSCITPIFFQNLNFLWKYRLKSTFYAIFRKIGDHDFLWLFAYLMETRKVIYFRRTVSLCLLCVLFVSFFGLPKLTNILCIRSCVSAFVLITFYLPNGDLFGLPKVTNICTEKKLFINNLFGASLLKYYLKWRETFE